MKLRPRFFIAVVLVALVLTGCTAQSVMFSGASWAGKRVYRSVREHEVEHSQSYAEPAREYDGGRVIAEK
jgi:hypothetical protein